MEFQQLAGFGDDIARVALNQNEESRPSAAGELLMGVGPLAGAFLKERAHSRYFSSSLVPSTRYPSWMPGGTWWRRRAGQFAEKQAIEQFERTSIQRGVSAFRGAFTPRIPMAPAGVSRRLGRGLMAGWRGAGPARGALAMSKFGGAVSTLGWALMLEPVALAAGQMVGGALQTLGQDRSHPNYGKPFQETRETYTMRQSGLDAIHQNQLQTRSFFAREAQYFHR